MASVTKSVALLKEAQKTLRGGSIFLAVLYAVFAVAHIFLSKDIAVRMALIAIATSAVMAVLAALSSKIPLERSHDVNALIAALILINSLAHLYFSGRLEESTNIMLVILAVSAFFASWPWFWTVVSVSIASWVLVTLPLFGTAGWGHYLFAIVLSTALATVYHRLRMNSAWSLAQAEAAEVERTYELADSNFELQRAARRLKDQAKELEKQNEILGENVRLKEDVERISRHDLRTPLNSIISLAQIVREDQSLAPEHEASLKLIEQAGYRVLNMANLTLDLFKMEQGTYQFTPKVVDVRAVVDRALLDLRALLRTQEVTCEVGAQGFAPGAAAPIRGDELLTHSMLTNLLKNAIEASPKGGRVAVTLVAGEFVEIRIHNCGAIPAEIRDRFFQKYATSGKKGGTGLGAYSAGLMAKTQGGRIRVESSEEAGTTVIVELVRAVAGELQAQPHEPAAAARFVFASDNWPARSVLVVDDDPDNRAILRHFLSHPRWKVDEAENGPLALQWMKTSAYDFVLLDIEMPIMDGFEVVEKITGDASANGGRRPALVALSSHDDEFTRDRALAAGFDRYVTKPVTREAIVQLVLGAEAAQTVTLQEDVRDLIPSFLESKKEEIKSATEAVERNDQEFARRAFHRLRGSFSLYGFADAAALCKELETLAQKNELAAAGARLPQLQHYLERIDIRYTHEHSEATG